MKTEDDIIRIARQKRMEALSRIELEVQLAFECLACASVLTDGGVEHILSDCDLPGMITVSPARSLKTLEGLLGEADRACIIPDSPENNTVFDLRRFSKFPKVLVKIVRKLLPIDNCKYVSVVEEAKESTKLVCGLHETTPTGHVTDSPVSEVVA